MQPIQPLSPKPPSSLDYSYHHALRLSHSLPVSIHQFWTRRESTLQGGKGTQMS